MSHQQFGMDGVGLRVKRTHETQHGNKRKTDHFFKVLRKFNSKFDCLVYHMLYIKDSEQAASLLTRMLTPFVPNCLRDTCPIFLFFLKVFLTLGFNTHRTCKYIMHCFTFFTFFICITTYTFSHFKLIIAYYVAPKCQSLFKTCFEIF